jgi:uncharacterized protein with FMN-binding domain
MRRIALWLASTATIVVLVFGYHTSTNRTTALAVPSARPSITTPATGTPSTSLTPPTGSGSPSPTQAATTTYTGDVAQTRWGPVQVAITVTGSKITAVDVVEYPNNNGRDQEINDYALPVLVQSTLAAQSAQIDVVSGATVTSDGYVESLQSALDKAGR